MKKAVRAFDRYLKEKSHNELNAFDETVEIFFNLIEPDPVDGYQALFERITEWIDFESPEELQEFFDRYFDYQNQLIDFFQQAVSIEDEMELDRYVSALAKELLATIPKAHRESEVIDRAYYFYERVMEIFGIENDPESEKVIEQMIHAFGGQEPTDILNFLILMAYESEQNNEANEEVQSTMVMLMIVFTHWVHRLRQLRHELAEKQQAFQQSFGGSANQTTYKVGRNDPCPCGSGKKYKKCCLNKPKDPLSSLKKLPEPQAPHPPLSEKEITEFYSVWSRFLAYVGNIFTGIRGERYRAIYAKDSEGKFYLKKIAIEDGYYLDLRKFLVNNFHDLIDRYIAEKRLSARRVEILKEFQTRHLLSDFYAIECFADGNAIFWDIKNDRCYYVYRNYDNLDRLLPQENTPFEALLLSYKGRILTDGAFGTYPIEMGANMQSMLAESYTEARKNLEKELPATPKPHSTIYQLKISIDGAKPPVWRRVLVASTLTFATLHHIIQILFDWDDYHLHEFRGKHGIYKKREIIEKSLRDGETAKDESLYSLEQELKKEGDRLKYVYDFGDDWRHTILLEKILPHEEGKRYPRCVNGRGESFEEDSGGIIFASDPKNNTQRRPFDKERINRIFEAVLPT